MNRLTRGLAAADAEIKAAKITNTEVEAVLDAALRAASHCERAYLTAPEHVRRQINQGFFEKLYIGQDGTVEGAELTEPFRPILGAAHGLVTEVDADAAAQDASTARPDDIKGMILARWGDSQVSGRSITDGRHKNTDRMHMHSVGGVKQAVMVGLEGLEPPTS